MNKQKFDQEYRSYVGDYLDHRLYHARYKNNNGFALAVVASIRFQPDGEIGDWSAYWGGCDLTQREEDAVRWVAKKGSKLNRDDAQHFFPGLPMSHYRG